MGLDAFSPGTQYTDLTTGLRYVKTTTNVWNIDKGQKGDVGPAGPQGIQGIQGIQGLKGDKGDPGTGSGTVNKVNTISPDGAGNVTLTAANVNALPATGATALNVATSWKGNNTNAPLTIYGNQTDSYRMSVLANGAIYSNSLLNSFYNVGVGDTTTEFGSGTYVLGVKNASVKPTVTPVNGVVAYSEAGVLKVLQSNGQTIQVGYPTSSKSTTITAPTVASYIVWQAPTDCTVTAVRAIRVGGTSATINASVNALDLLPLDLSLTVAGSWSSGPNLQNTAIKAGDSLTIAVRSVAGSPTAVTIQVDVKG
jgi:hypothetical protein